MSMKSCVQLNLYMYVFQFDLKKQFNWAKLQWYNSVTWYSMLAFSQNKLINIQSGLAPGICVLHFIQGSVSTINVPYQNVIKTRFTSRNLLVSCWFLSNMTGKWLYVVTSLWMATKSINTVVWSQCKVKIPHLWMQINRSFNHLIDERLLYFNNFIAWNKVKILASPSL